MIYREPKFRDRCGIEQTPKINNLDLSTIIKKSNTKTNIQPRLFHILPLT